MAAWKPFPNKGKIHWGGEIYQLCQMESPRKIDRVTNENSLISDAVRWSKTPDWITLTEIYWIELDRKR